MKGVPIRKDLIDIQKRDTKIAEYWARIRVKGVRGGVKVALAHQPFNFSGKYANLCSLEGMIISTFMSRSRRRLS